MNDMTTRPTRRVTVLTDNDSWVLPYSQHVVDIARSRGDEANLVKDQRDLPEGDIAFFLGCVNIVKPNALARNKRNLVVHASDLPKGRGFSPWTWLVLEGRDRIPVCLINAADQVDSGAIVYKEDVELSGTELVDDLRGAIGRKTVELCGRFLSETVLPPGQPQEGEASNYPRRTPRDSELDVDKHIRGQFNLLRTVDNDRYPAFFCINGAKYILRIERFDGGED
jgi:methionyl-tRNA formyltransferase